MKNGPSIPGWAAGVAVGVLVLILLVVGIKMVNGGGPLPDSQYPKEAFKPPTYDPSKYGGYMKDGKPVGAPPATSSQGGTQSKDPYSGAYGQRPN